jgi:molecular chaperone GrpE
LTSRAIVLSFAQAFEIATKFCRPLERSTRVSKADDDVATPKPADSASGDAGNGGADAAAAGGPAGASEVEKLRGALAAAEERILRERAELENVRKRAAREKGEALRFANEALVRDLLPVIDNLRRALEHARGGAAGGPIVEGVEMVMRSLTDVLARHGVREVEARGTRFDPSFHEAIGHVESDGDPNAVVDEHQRGYVLHDRLLRPALVTVGKGRGGGGPVERPDDDG